MEDMEQEINFNKYQNGKVYKIIDNTNGDIYIGSTYETLARRLSKHKSDYNRYLIGKHNYVTSFKIFANNDFEIVLIELYPCNSKAELTAREQYYIKTNTSVNKVLPGRTKQEYHVDNRDKILEQKKIYRETNQEQIKKSRKIYYENNKNEIKYKNKIYRDTHKQQRKEQGKNYYVNNRDKILLQQKQQFTCNCGGQYTCNNRSKHFNTKKHQNFVSNQNIETETI